MKIQDILVDESCWTQGIYARRADDTVVTTTRFSDFSFNDPQACKFCISAAGQKAYGEQWPRIAEKIRAAALLLFGHNVDSTIRWNDAPERTFAEIRQVIELADV